MSAWAGEGDWQTVVTGPITIKNRSVSGSPIKEVWAEGVIEAPAREVQEALMDVAALPAYIPYTKEAWKFGGKQPDGGDLVYTRIALPIVGERDYVVRLRLVTSLSPDGTGVFRNAWQSESGRWPRRPGVIRIEQISGSWEITPLGDGHHCWAVYKFAVNPGGRLPTFAINLGNELGVKETYDAVAREGARRKSKR